MGCSSECRAPTAKLVADLGADSSAFVPIITLICFLIFFFGFWLTICT